MRYKYGGEGGIRTLDTVLSVYPLSRQADGHKKSSLFNIICCYFHLFCHKLSFNIHLLAGLNIPKGPDQGSRFF